MLLAETATAGTRGSMGHRAANWARQPRPPGTPAHGRRLQNDRIRAPPLTSAERLPAAPNGGSVRGYQAIFVPLAALSSPGYSPVGGQPAVYLYIAALEANCPLMPRTGSSVAGLTQDVAVPGWPAASRQPRTLLAGSLRHKKSVAERNPYLRSSREEPPMRPVQRRLGALKRAF
jgi:hypothetical protein